MDPPMEIPGSSEWSLLDDENQKLRQQIADLQLVHRKLHLSQGGWIYQGDGEDHLESLTCPVIIQPADLMELLDCKKGMNALRQVCAKNGGPPADKQSTSSEDIGPLGSGGNRQLPRQGINALVLDRLLHIANSYPGAVDRARFYAMKDRVLTRYGHRDGFDVQHIEGKQCRVCQGKGIYVGYHTYSGDRWEDTCNHCWGSGWYKRPVWIVLHRYRFGRFTFHIPGEKSYERPEPDVTRIVGYVEHPVYSYRRTQLACIALGLLFDWRLAWDGSRDVWRQQAWLASLRRRCSRWPEQE